MDKRYSFEDFIEIVETLRSDSGCPWDRVQTHNSLKRCMIEEAYEVVDGIRLMEETGSSDNLREELGDVLLQVVMHAQIAAEEDSFTLADVIQEVSEKMIRRHPHVFGKEKAGEAGQIQQSWEEIKQQEKQQRTPVHPLMEIPHSFPALIRAEKVQKKLDNLYHECRNAEDSLKAAQRCIQELQQGSREDSRGFGELLWHIASAAREKQVHSEQALTEYLEEMIRNYR